MKTSFCLSTTYIEKSIVKCEEPHKFDWKPNSNIPSGSYFVKLSSSHFGEVSKIVYLK